MRCILLFAFFSPLYVMAQPNILPKYDSWGGNYMFKRCFIEYTKTPLDGYYVSDANTPPLKSMTFDNGKLMSFTYYFGDNGTLSDTMWHTGKRDTFMRHERFIGGKLTERIAYYYDKKGRKGVRREDYMYLQPDKPYNGLRMIENHLFVKAEEIKGQQYTDNPESYDQEGYYYRPAMAGEQYEYWPEGTLKYKYNVELIPELFDSPDYCTNGPFERRHPNGNMQQTGELSKGHFHSTIRSFYPNGTPFEVQAWNYGFKQGEHLAYFENGKMMSKSFFFNDQMTKSDAWHDNGKLKYERRLDSMGNGRDRTWNEKGLLIADEEIDYFKLSERGTSTYWYDNGKMKKQLNAPDGSGAKVYNEFSPEGNLWMHKEEKNTEEGLIQLFQFWNDKGIKVKDAYSLMGAKTYQKIQIWYQDGTKKSVMEWFGAGGDSVIYQFWHPNGQPRLHYLVRQNKLNGSYKRYFENGTPHISANYFENIRDGEYAEFLPNGTLKFSNSYNKGVPKKLPNLPIEYPIVDSLQYEIAEIIAQNRLTAFGADTAVFTSSYDSILFFTRLAMGAWGRSGYTNPKKNPLETIEYLVQFDYRENWMRKSNSAEWQQLRKEMAEMGIQLPDTLVMSQGLPRNVVFSQADAVLNCYSINHWLRKRCPGITLMVTRYNNINSSFTFKKIHGAWSILQTQISLYEWDMRPRLEEAASPTYYYEDGTYETPQSLLGVLED